MAHRPFRSPNERAGHMDADRRMRLVVSSTEGDVAVVNAQTGTIPWRRRTGRALGTLTQDGERFYLPLGPLLSLRDQERRARTQDERQRFQMQQLAPTQLEARRLTDGSPVWVVTDWTLAGRLHVEMDRGTLLAASGKSPEDMPGAELIYALDASTGAVRWTVAGSHALGYMDRLVAARGGRVFVHKAGTLGHLHVLDGQTGQELWSDAANDPWIVSPKGTLVAKPHLGYSGEGSLTLLQAEDGREVGRVPVWGWLQMFSDEGVAYATADDSRQPWVAAIDARRGATLAHGWGARGSVGAGRRSGRWASLLRGPAPVPANR